MFCAGEQKARKTRNVSVLVLISGFLKPLEVITDSSELLCETGGQIIHIYSVLQGQCEIVIND